MSVRRLYLKATSASALAKIFNAVGSIALIWIITRIAGKEGFGLSMLAYSLHYVLAMGLASFFQSIQMYHLSREPDAHREKSGANVVYATILGFFLALASIAVAPFIAQSMGKTEVAPWLSAMAWMIPAFCANAVLTNHDRSVQDVPRMVLYFENMPMALRLALLLPLVWMPLGMETAVLAICWAHTISYALPTFISYARRPIPLRFSGRHFTLWDVQYGLHSMLAQVVNKSLRNVVVFVLGFFTSTSVVADFAVAMRFGNFLQMPKLAIGQLQVPRMGAQIKAGKSGELLREFNVTRSISLSTTLFGTALFVLASPLLFVLFGEYKSAYSLFLLLAIGSIIRAGFGTIGGYTNIAGYAGLSLLSNILTLVLTVALLPVLIPSFGENGAGYALIFGAFFSMGSTALIVLHRDNLNTFTWNSALAMLASGAVLWIRAHEGMNDVWCFVLLVLITLGSLITDIEIRGPMRKALRKMTG